MSAPVSSSVADSTPVSGTMRAAPWFMLAVLTLVNMINWADRNVVPILFPAIGSELALSDTQLGVIGGLAFSAIYAISSFAFGYASDRSIRRNVIAFGLVVWSVATATSGLATSFWSLFAARFFTGIGEASLYPAAMSMIAERFPASTRGRAMGIFGAAAAVGGGLGIGLGGPLSEAIGWRSVFFIYGAVGVLALPVVLSVPEAPRPAPTGEDAETGKVLRGLIRDGRLIMLWTSGLVMIGSGIGFATWVPSYFVRFWDIEVGQAGLVFGLSMLVGGVGGAIVGGVIADARGKLRVGGQLDVSIAAALLGAPLAAGALLFKSLPLVMALGFLTPVAIFAYFPPIQAVIVEIVPPRRHGIAYAINVLFLGGMGTALGPFLVGLVSDITGSLATGMIVPIVGMLLAAVLMVIARSKVAAGAPR